MGIYQVLLLYLISFVAQFSIKMETDARPPGKLSNNGLVSKNWRRWKQDFLIYMKLTGGIKKQEDEKLAWLKNLIGDAGLEALENISFERPDDKENFKIVMQKLEEYFDPPNNVVKERNIFFSRSKENNESIDDYIKKLKVSYYSILICFF